MKPIIVVCPYSDDKFGVWRINGKGVWAGGVVIKSLKEAKLFANRQRKFLRKEGKKKC